MIPVIVASVYALHAVSLPPGWALVSHDFGPAVSTQPTSEAIARNGTVAILLTRASDHQGQARRLLIERLNGTRVMLTSQSTDIVNAFRRFIKPVDCIRDINSCPFFEKVTLAPDGTPFVTLGHYFSGAYSGELKASFVWNGAWHLVPSGKPFAGVGKPYDPDSISISAADSLTRFAYVGDYRDDFPHEDLDFATRDPYYMADLSGISSDGLNAALGIGSATAMRGPFVAGFDADVKEVPYPQHDATALIWRCSFNMLGTHRPCKRSALGSGIAYGIDSRGDAVGDNEPQVSQSAGLELHSPGFPVLWRSGSTVVLSKEIHGAAYAISDSGVIAGTLVSGAYAGAQMTGFVASALTDKPAARPLDDLVQNSKGWHVEAGLGVADDGRILALVTHKGDARTLAVLVPASH